MPGSPGKKEILGHPIGLATLFFTELWERLSYYGMRAILVLYMVAAIENGGLGWDNKRAALIYGTYTSSVYLLSMAGGWAADSFLGARLAVLIGGVVIAMGHFSMAFSNVNFFYAGLVLIVIGTGLLKPNISAMVGGLYEPGDVRRDAGFSIFYMGINMGAFLAPFVCGTLAQSVTFRSMLHSWGFHPQGSWHWGFGAAGVGMVLGLIQYVWGGSYLASVGKKPENAKAPPIVGFILYLGVVAAVGCVLFGLSSLSGAMLWSCIGFIGGAFLAWLYWQVRDSGQEMKRMTAALIFTAAAALFWAIFEQAGSSLTLFTDKLTNSSVLGIQMPSSFFQAVNPLFIIALAPVFAILWVKWGERQPSSPLKFTIGLLFAGLGFVAAAYAATGASTAAQASGNWLILIYLVHTIGELCLSPVGLSTMTKLAPERLVGLVMGIWFLAPAIGNYIGGVIAGHFDETRPETVVTLFWDLARAGIIGAVIMGVAVPAVRKLMCGVK